jgi:hypothetical protein
MSGEARVSGTGIGVSILGKVNQAKTKAATVGGTVAARRGFGWKTKTEFLFFPNANCHWQWKATTSASSS